MKKYFLLTPGPANISDRVAEAQLNIYTCHRDQDFIVLMQRIREKLVKLAKGDENYTSILITSSGTGAVEAALSSCVSNSEKILIINNGSYCERMIDISQIYNIPHISLDYEWGQLPNLKEIEDKLNEDKEITHIGMVHHETTTGVLNPLHEIGQLAKKYNKILIIDAISSFCGEDINVIDDNIAFCIASSNKCIQAPPGIGFVIAKKSELERLKDKKRRNFYLSLYDQWLAEEKDSPRFTPATQTLHGLDEAIIELNEEGMENRKQRYASTARIIRDGLESMGFRLHLFRNIMANNITSIDIPNNFPLDELRSKLREEGYIIRSKVKENNTFRIANLGKLTEQDANKFVQVFKDILNEMNYKIEYS